MNGEPTGCGTPGVYCSSISPDNASWGSVAWQLVQSCGSTCTPTTCAAQGKTCGSMPNGCGATLTCGTCSAGQTCSATNVCQGGSSCSPSIAGYGLGKCNATAVFGGKLYRCLSQAAGVNGEPVGCGTPGVLQQHRAGQRGVWIDGLAARADLPLSHAR